MITSEQASYEKGKEAMPMEVKYFSDGYGVDWIGTGIISGEIIKKRMKRSILTRVFRD